MQCAGFSILNYIQDFEPAKSTQEDYSEYRNISKTIPTPFECVR